MYGKKTKRVVILMLSFLIATVTFFGVIDYIVPDSITVFDGEELSVMRGIRISYDEDDVEDGSVTASAMLLGVVPVKSVSVEIFKDVKLYPGGMAFGVELHTDGVMIVGLSSVTSGGASLKPGEEAGLMVNDIITAIDGVEVHTVSEVTDAIGSSAGRSLVFTCKRGDEKVKIDASPVLSDTDAVYKLGIWVRDSSAGIGTVTFVEPESSVFGGLGHAICDVDTGEVVPIASGSIADVEIVGIKRGTVGEPGELRGYFTSTRAGAIIDNNECGVFGVMTELPDGFACEPLPIALSDEIHEGDAYIYCTLDGGGIRKYSVSISNLNNLGDTKNMKVTVTDPELLAKTGGIVQGMSGSPIVQDGKIIGAVTHVLINDPTSGYGIYIENMLRATSLKIAK